VYRYEFTVPASREAWYALGGKRYEVNADFGGDLRIAYVSCNGQEHGDRARDEAERNAMWQRLGTQHKDEPYHLLLHGGDQIYADEVVEVHPASEGWPKNLPDHLSDEDTKALRNALWEAFFDRYARQYAHADFAFIAARVPSLSMWDDHDICDGWGSLKEEALDSAVGRTLFEVARECFLLFQFGNGRHETPVVCADVSGRSLTFAMTLPGLTIIAPDLRSERRPHKVMGENGWRGLRAAFSEVDGGHVIVLSSVPALGPRLSVLEWFIPFVPKLRKYEDDLRDQWQSKAHRQEWQEFLTELMVLDQRPGVSVTVVSGEIHLATHATMATANGELHQLVASGIAHPPPPRVFARGLGAFASLGEAPLAGHPITIHGLPGKANRYTAERNFLRIERRGGTWSAVWELEDSGPTPALPL
ncbi:MAG: alkaline phosphatase D family protein, partial [Pseudomonadota bacterium]